MSPIAQKINAILAEEFEIDSDLLEPQSSIRDDLALDSLDAVDLTVMLEEQAGIQVEAKAFADLKTLGDIHKLVESLVDEGS